jgi:hypothetical protein
LCAVHVGGLLFQFLLLGVLDVLQLGHHELQALRELLRVFLVDAMVDLFLRQLERVVVLVQRPDPVCVFPKFQVLQHLRRDVSLHCFD